MKDKLVILRLGDDEINDNFLIRTKENYRKIEKVIQEIVNKFIDEDDKDFNEEWNFGDIITKLEERKLVKFVETDGDWEIYA
jgi:hypothetical protein